MGVEHAGHDAHNFILELPDLVKLCFYGESCALHT